MVEWFNSRPIGLLLSLLLVLVVKMMVMMIVYIIFNNISLIVGQWMVEYEMLCAMNYGRMYFRTNICH